MARSKGTAIFAVNFEPTGQSPLDARLVVDTIADLTAEETYADKNYYKGMTVTVNEDASIYVLTDPSQITSSASWKKVDAGAAEKTVIVNDLTTGGATSALSAEQGKVLKGLIDTINDTTIPAITDRIDDLVGEDGQGGTIKQAIEDAVNELKTTIDAYTVNGHKISENPVLTKADVGLTNVTDDAQVKRSEMGVANGVATLDENGKVPVSQLNGQLASVQGVDQVVTSSTLPESPEAQDMVWCTDDKKFREYNGESWDVIDPREDTIYNFRSSDATGSSSRTNILYRWDGADLVEISASIALGETNGTAYEGSKGAANRAAINALPATVITALGAATPSATNVTIAVTTATKSGMNYGSPAAGTPIIIPVATKFLAGLMSATDKAALDELKGDGSGSVQDQIQDAITDLKGDAAEDYNTLGKLEDKIQELDTKKPNEYSQNATTGNSVQVTAATHKCGTNVIVQTYYQGEQVDCNVAVATNGDVTVSWNGSIVTTGTPLKVVIIGK